MQVVWGSTRMGAVCDLQMPIGSFVSTSRRLIAVLLDSFVQIEGRGKEREKKSESQAKLTQRITARKRKISEPARSNQIKCLPPILPADDVTMRGVADWSGICIAG